MTNKKAILQAFNQFGRLTDYDLEQVCGIDGNSVRPARQALERAGVIVRTGNRIMHPGKVNGYREYEIVKQRDMATIRMPINISNFLELVKNLRAGKSSIQLTDGVAIIDGSISIKIIKPHKIELTGPGHADAPAIEPKPEVRHEPRQLEQNSLFDYEEERSPSGTGYKVLRPNSKKPFVTAKHYRARVAIGIHSKRDIKTFKLENLPKLNQETKDDLLALGIDTLGNLLATSILGIRNRIVGKDGKVNENYMNGLVDNIRSALEPLGLKFTRFHPHRENPDGTPKLQVS